MHNWIYSIFSQCTSLTDPTMHGICFSSEECQAKSGSIDGNCAAGFGVCCMFV